MAHCTETLNTKYNKWPYFEKNKKYKIAKSLILLEKMNIGYKLNLQKNVKKIIKQKNKIY